MYDRRVRIKRILIVYIFDFVCASVGAWKKYTFHLIYFVVRPARRCACTAGVRLAVIE